MAGIQQRHLRHLAMVFFVLIATSPAAALLPKPSISMNPVGEVAWGQSANITCAISTRSRRGSFILEEISGSFRETKRSRTNSATFSIEKLNFDREGSYQCRYQSHTWQNYRPSDSIRLSVVVPLQQPCISLTSPDSGLLWGPEGAQITRGNKFAFTCSINSSYSEGRFFLIFSGSNLTHSKPAVNLSATFNFPVAEYEHQGNYSCVYEVTLSSRTFTSAQNESLSLIIKMALLPLVSSVVAGGLVLLVIALVVVCLVYKRRRKALEPGAHIQTQMAVRFRNNYECEDGDNDYENVDIVNTKKKLKEKAGNMKEEDIDDFEEAGPGPNFLKTKRVLFNAQQKRQEVEESSDDEPDYENVSKSFGEQRVAIYEQHQDIYQNL